MQNRLFAASAIATLLAGAACTVNQQSAPALTGPSEAALSLKMAVTPDRILQDGAQFSRISVTAFDPSGKAIPVAVHLDALATVGGTTQAFGTLSSINVMTTTDANSPTSVTYIPPTATNNVTTASADTTVTIQARVIASDSVTGSMQQVNLIVSPATVLAGVAPNAVMTVSPIAPAQSLGLGKPIFFDASASCGSQLVAGACPGTRAIVSFVWNFGDGTPNQAGSTTTHTYTTAGTYSPQVTITNDKGLVAAASQTFIIATADVPTASYNVSPTTINAAQGRTAFFNGAASSASSGHGIVLYTWNFGDGTSGTSTSATISHIYGAANIYKTTLTVTDDLGQTATVSVDVTVT